MLGQSGLPTGQMPQAGQIAGGALSYYLHAGGHGTVPSDWAVFLGFMETYLAQQR